MVTGWASNKLNVQTESFHNTHAQRKAGLQDFGEYPTHGLHKQLWFILRPWHKGQIYKNWDSCLPRLGCPAFLHTFPHISTATGKPPTTADLGTALCHGPAHKPLLDCEGPSLPAHQCRLHPPIVRHRAPSNVSGRDQCSHPTNESSKKKSNKQRNGQSASQSTNQSSDQPINH